MPEESKVPFLVSFFENMGKEKKALSQTLSELDETSDFLANIDTIVAKEEAAKKQSTLNEFDNLLNEVTNLSGDKATTAQKTGTLKRQASKSISEDTTANAPAAKKTKSDLSLRRSTLDDLYAEMSQSVGGNIVDAPHKATKSQTASATEEKSAPARPKTPVPNGGKAPESVALRTKEQRISKPLPATPAGVKPWSKPLPAIPAKETSASTADQQSTILESIANFSKTAATSIQSVFSKVKSFFSFGRAEPVQQEETTPDTATYKPADFWTTYISKAKSQDPTYTKLVTETPETTKTIEDAEPAWKKTIREIRAAGLKPAGEVQQLPAWKQKIAELKQQSFNSKS